MVNSVLSNDDIISSESEKVVRQDEICLTAKYPYGIKSNNKQT